ncbi:MAG TPA: DUF4434 domain-containing protein [Verrucomicrobiota bacterium]|nr:DUF4434 domain-containing protein [Verrucomicrobiota bacterium]OQC63354.1 MAG: Serine/threonine-protein kinase pkn1 [Verrucomicrobia bacterium ADurb.Bin006]HNV00092.1 DUF4434 domain-containing protein [Verrucomicrobiota bacterium]HOA60267.1 DUF4434 domain-containing protein [Verrucomicrobiota bacterium]HOF47494.1 DUF4434 domain-containing protein [Verrucomicrobiota bacterium]
MLLAGLALAPGCWPVSAAAPTPLRLAGSFVQYQSELQTWAPETWHAVLDRMRDLRLNTIIIQMLERENHDGTTHSFIGSSGLRDATEIILDYADAHDFEVYLGLYLPNWNHDMTGGEFLAQTQGRMASTAQRAWARYQAGLPHRSFAGWYIPYEPWTADYQPAEVARLKSFFRGIAAACAVISGDAPLAISPFISNQRPSPCRVEKVYRELLDQTGIGLLLLQDSVGAQQWETDIVQRVAPYAQAFKNACDAAGVRFWANLESFRISDGVYMPCDALRLRRQFDATAPYVERFVTFDFLHYMNPVAFLSHWNQARREGMQRLYADYQTAFVSADYDPWASPTIAARLRGEQLTLIWEGNAGDRFQLQSMTDLLGVWTPVDAPITTNQTGAFLADTSPAPHRTRFYRVQRLSRLEMADSMRWVPAGEFVMGTPAEDTNRTAGELGQFRAGFTRGFWISRHEVTQSEYQNLMCTNPAAYATNLDCPVERVSWHEAMDYCARLTQQERQAGRLPDGFIYRLPSEAEWEYAARAGTSSAFCYGDDPALLGAYGWHSGNSGLRPHPVGELAPNSWGLEDVHGNVFEWCWDWIESSPPEPVADLIGTITGPTRAVRGGGWSFPWVNCRCSWRAGYPPVARHSFLGFRVVLAQPSL